MFRFLVQLVQLGFCFSSVQFVSVFGSVGSTWILFFKLDSNCALRSSTFFALHIREESSASSAYITVLHVTTSGKQLTKIMNSKGPKIEP